MARVTNTVFLVLCLYFQSKLAVAQLASVTVSYKVMPEQRSFDGRIEAINQATVSAQTHGRIEDINVDIGDMVKSGTVILTIIKTEQLASLTQAEANVSEATSNLIVETSEYKRIKDLFTGDYIAKSDMDKAKARFIASTAKMNIAQAALNTAKAQLSYTTVKAPYTGVVSARYVEPGELVQPGTRLFSGYNPYALRVEVDLPQNIAQKVRQLGLALVIPMNGESVSDGILPTKLILYPTIDTVTSTVKVRLELSPYLNTTKFSGQTNNQFIPGEFVKVRFTVGETKRLLIPLSSIVYRSEVTAVYVIKEGKPILRQVRPGEIFTNQLEVLAGLRDGDIVATDPVAAAIELTNLKQSIEKDVIHIGF